MLKIVANRTKSNDDDETTTSIRVAVDTIIRGNMLNTYKKWEYAYAYA